MNELCIYNPDVLVELAQEYLTTQNDFRTFCLHPGKDPNTNRRTIEFLYDRYSRDAFAAETAFIQACRLVNANRKTVLSTVKAMRRYEKRNHWQVCARLPYGFNWDTGVDYDETICRYWSNRDPF